MNRNSYTPDTAPFMTVEPTIQNDKFLIRAMKYRNGEYHSASVTVFRGTREQAMEQAKRYAKLGGWEVR